ncbi:unnamed protein product, partial [Effrenium voratum]
MRVASHAVLAGLPFAAGCSRGQPVWVADEFLRGEVLQRFPGAVLVRLEDGGNATLPPTRLRSRFGQLCARAALCFFGRVGNVVGKFDEAGSSEEALEFSSSTVWEHVVRANPDFAWDIFAHTWDEHLVPAIRRAFGPRRARGARQPSGTLPVQSFGRAVAEAAALKREEE